MRRAGYSACFLALALAAGGCAEFTFPGAPGADKRKEDPKTTELARKVSELEKANSALRSERSMLVLRVQELEAREKALSAELRRVQFMNRQQEHQIKALADAPAERDRSKQLAESLRAEVELLRAEVRRLRGGGAPTPATTTAPSQPPHDQDN